MSHHLDMFSSVLEYNLVYLYDARSIVMTSFFSLKSISHLDLQISELPVYVLNYDDRSYLLQKNFFCTEESFRNNIVPDRRILYALNLDVPKGREYSHLKSGFAPDDLPYKSGNISNVFVAVTGHDYYFRNVLEWLIESDFAHTDSRLKWMKWMANFAPNSFVCFSRKFQYTCAMTLYHDCGDSEFTLKFFEKFIELRTYCRIRDLEVLEHLLRTARMCDFKIRGEKTDGSSLTDYSMEYLGFRAVPSILKYEDAVYYTESAYQSLMYYILLIRDIDYEMFELIENRIRKSRLYRIMQIIRIFTYSYLEPNFIQLFQPSDCVEALRLVWSSIPDSYVLLEEMTEAFENEFSSDFISQAHEFYEDSIGQTVSHREPRVLIQYCRTAIRRSLCQSKQWLPDGINQLNLPTRFKSYLNLQRDHTHPLNFQAPLGN